MGFAKTLHTTLALSIVLAACAPEAPEEPFAAPDAPEAPAPSPDPAPIHDPGPGEHLMFTPTDLDWQAGPPSFEPGSEMVVLEGDPAEAGVFTMRFRLPDGFTIAPHWHPNTERVTVISGTFRLGTGETLDVEGTEVLPAGSYTTIPPETRHFAVAEGETVVQLTSVGPWEIEYVNPEDDPRRRD